LVRMRVFIGIKTGCERYLSSLQNELKKAGTGNFTDAGNLHITLRFLGEVPPSRLRDICEAVSEAGGAAFLLECRGVRAFHKSGIVFAEVGGELLMLAGAYARLEAALEKRGFAREARAFRPHITLARNFRADGGLDIASIPYGGCGFKVEEVILFESRRTGGRLVYTPLFAHRLGG